MSSLTKNPLVLQSANHIYNWFLTKIKSKEELIHFNMVNEIETDKAVLKFIDKVYSNDYKYKDIETRHKISKEEVGK